MSPLDPQTNGLPVCFVAVALIFYCAKAHDAPRPHEVAQDGQSISLLGWTN